MVLHLLLIIIFSHSVNPACPTGTTWEQRNKSLCLRAFTQPRSFFRAKSTCKIRSGGEMAVAPDPEMQTRYLEVFTVGEEWGDGNPVSDDENVDEGVKKRSLERNGASIGMTQGKYNRESSLRGSSNKLKSKKLRFFSFDFLLRKIYKPLPKNNFIWINAKVLGGSTNASYWDAVNEQALRHVKWFPGEPNNIRSREFCAAYHVGEKRLNDMDCRVVLPFVCVANMGTESSSKTECE